MTREERIDWLCRLRSNIQCYMDVATLPKDVKKKFEEALSETISSLEETVHIVGCDQCVKANEDGTCNDAISRNGIKEKYRQFIVRNLKDDERGIDLSEYAEEPCRRFNAFIDSLPSVQPSECEECGKKANAIAKYSYDYGKQDARRKGHWIDYSEDGYVECPFCEHATNCEDDIDELHYCFYCGAELSADMTGAE